MQKKYKVYSYFILLLILCSIETYAQRRSYVKTTAKKGDGIFLLLARYNLERHDCNFTKFCALNNLKRNSALILGKTYTLPLYEYRFNGKSIRSSTGIETWQAAKRVERYNDGLTQLKIKTEDFRRGKQKLWVPYSTFACTPKVEKFIPQNRTFPIFGKKYEQVPLEDKRLAGAVYYIVAGHGGPDPGAMSTYQGKNICEDEYAYDISLRLARNLLKHGAMVYMITRDPNDGIRDEMSLTCDVDEVCWGGKTIPLNQKERLTQRSDAINELYAANEKKGVEYQRMIEIHVDSRSESQRIDLFFYHYPGSQLGKLLSDRLHKTIKDKYAIHRKNGEYYGTVTGRDLHMLREVDPLATFVEVANIQNPNDQKRILLKSNRQALADWLAEGLIKDY
ncbi:MAG: N-acetylmuramoyl-L-alanine amidase [Saprospiraceae bacterium]|nr:N-acetylmuramoyl-L-alanine amidase [Saprospiraceae bacterium]